MSISKRVLEAIESMEQADPEAALIPASIATAATAALETPRKTDRETYRQFLHENLELVTRVALGGVGITQNLMFKYSCSELIPDGDGRVTIEQILYHAVRCSLMHKAKLPETLHFQMESPIILERGVLTLPGSFIYGLIAAIIGAASNTKESIPEKYCLQTPSGQFVLNEFWGQSSKILKLYRAKNTT